MATEVQSPAVIPAPLPRRRKKPTAPQILSGLALLAAVAACAAFGLWNAGLWGSSRAESEQAHRWPTATVDRGPVASYLIETGSLESARNTTILCEVEALLGTIGGPGGGMGGMGGRSGAGSGSMAGAGSGSMAGAGTTGGVGTGDATGAGGDGPGGADGAGTGGGGMSGGMGGGSMASALANRPNLRSFTLRVVPHMPSRSPMSQPGQASSTLSSQQNFGGGGGGGGRDREEQAGSTRIIWLIPEGTHVEPGELVAELDDVDFVNELQEQRIRHAQAKSWVDNAHIQMTVAEIELREYRDGIYPQDVQNVEQYIESCQTKEREAKMTLDWSTDLFRQGYRSEAQFLGDQYDYEQWNIELENALEMRRRLVEYTAPRIIKSLEAKIEAVRSDLLSQQAAFQVEDERLNRLERAIANCRLYAPAEGVVVYAREDSMWGSTRNQIAEGVTVREGQAIINLPDPEHMQVEVKVNESKIRLIRQGQNATVRIDAFPDRPLRGQVEEIKPIPAKANMVSDVNLYTVVVVIEGGWDDLRPGLTAEVAFHRGSTDETTRVPLAAIRWVGEEPFAAVSRPDGFDWRSLELGILSPSHAEVLAGLEPGDRVVADPYLLPRPEPDATAAERRIARADGQP